jgi:hypothetical protein
MVVALFVSSTTAMARPAPDPLRPPADKPAKRGKSPPRLSAKAKAHYARAVELYRRKKYDLAKQELELAGEASPDPALHYSIAIVDIALDQCDDAISEFQHFLDAPHGDDAIKAASDGIQTCKDRLPPPPPPAPPPPTPPPPEPEPHPVVHATSASTRHWYRDWLGDGLVATGAISGIVGLVFYSQALGELDAADASKTLADHARHVDNAGQLRTEALVAGSVGLALVTGGVIRYLAHDRGEEPRRNIAVVPLRGGGVITMSGSLP